MVPSQIWVNAVVAASTYFLVAVGFALIYSTSRVFHFAHGAIVALGAYVALSASTHLQPALALPTAVVACSVMGWLNYWLVYSPLLRRQAPGVVTLVASLGAFVVIQNGISLIYGDEMQAVRIGLPTVVFGLFGASVTSIQFLQVLVGLGLGIALWSLLRLTSTGLVLRAVANDVELCRAVGVPTGRIVGLSFLVGSAMAGAAGALMAADTNAFPTMGFRALLMGATAVLVSSRNNLLGIALGALLVAASQHVGAWFLSAKWQDAVAFGLLVLVLAVRPQGLLGES
jgi:branched-subunit amino acid ABC-type transport system permease component